MTDRLGRSYSRKPGRRRAPASKTLGDQCFRFGVRVSKEERQRLEEVCRENINPATGEPMTITELFRLAMNTFVEDYREGAVIFVRRSQVASIVRQERMF